MDAAIPADAQNAPTGIWKSRTEREIPTAPTPIIVVVNERKNNGDSNSVAKPSTESDQAQVTLAAFVSGVVWANVGSAVGFASLLSSAVVFRRRPDAHKRLMLLASVSIIGPALARIARWSVFGGEQGPFTPVVIWCLLLSIAAHDLWSRKRLHPATVLGTVLLVLLDYGGRLVARSDIGQVLVRELR